MYWNKSNFTWDFRCYKRLTLTWDVLKCRCGIRTCNLIAINTNMRCIEMAMNVMWCGYATGLTLTWDVLKYFLERSNMYNFYKINTNMRCIEMSQRESLPALAND